MKHSILIVSFFATCLFNLNAQVNRALLVAIDRYPENSGWTEIHASNDLKILLPLLKQNGYKQENICILQNESATKAAIIKALNKIVAKSKKGDRVYIHFSCHGQCMADDNGDEEDGVDEALIPYDAFRRFTKDKYEGENHLRDDELNIYLEKIRKKLTKSGNLIIALDACHSGTGSRVGDDDDYIRGTSYVFAPDGYEIPEIQNVKTIQHHRQGKNLSAISIFGACQANETNYEYKDPVEKDYYGTLTYILVKIMKENSEECTVTQFYEKIREEMQNISTSRKKKQTPYFETTDESKSIYIGK
ncbi:MAG: caspase family protein [Dysgonamonadaceae bacterium]|jgi:hypothetical protein|nr:caspase family protein [Dysgonamonadaceae bacterium]